MWDYIVLGQIPGTQVQITFEIWLLASTSLLAVLFAVRYVRSLRLAVLWIKVFLLTSWRAQQLSFSHRR